MKIRDILGHIDCPTCGTVAGMRITPDKNGDPFGYCEANCGQQLRIGGDKRRVRDFIALYPWASGAENPVTVTEPKTAPEPVTVTPEKPPVTIPKRPTLADSLANAANILGVR